MLDTDVSVRRRWRQIPVRVIQQYHVMSTWVSVKLIPRARNEYQYLGVRILGYSIVNTEYNEDLGTMSTWV